MKSLYTVIVRPLVTEKSSAQKAEFNQVTFEVAPAANKAEIRRAVEKLFEVDVLSVNTSIVRGKTKRVGKSFGRQKNWKKAVVTLAEGTDLDVFGTPTFEGEPEEE